MDRKVERLAIVLALIVAVVLVIFTKAQRRSASVSDGAARTSSAPSLPKVLDFGRGQCIPCKMMAPILKELQAEYKGRAIIEIIDIGDHPAQADKYSIQLIPTQVFIDSTGKEVFRHEGFMPKEDIVAKLKEMGVQ